MKLLESRAKYNYGNPNVELTIELDDDELEYIHLAEIDGIKHFTLSKTSIFEYMTDTSISADDFCVPEFIEDYGSVEDAAGSVFREYYKVALRGSEQLQLFLIIPFILQLIFF